MMKPSRTGRFPGVGSPSAHTWGSVGLLRADPEEAPPLPLELRPRQRTQLTKNGSAHELKLTDFRPLTPKEHSDSGKEITQLWPI